MLYIDNVSGLICYRIWRVHRASRDMRVSGLRPLQSAVRLILESGALYSFASLVLLVTNFAHSNALYPVSDALVPFIAILFDIVIVRVSWLRLATESQLAAKQQSTAGSVPLSVRASTALRGQTLSATGPASPAIEVSVHKDVRLDPSDEASFRAVKLESGEVWGPH
jgi:hypothetical protein